MARGAATRERSAVPITVRSIDSPLGRWTHHEWSPPRLAGLVDHRWHFDGRMTLPRERGFPGGYLEIILHLGPRFRAVDDAGTAGDAFPVACVTGLQLASAARSPCCTPARPRRPWRSQRATTTSRT
jgi:hypothetical protein